MATSVGSACITLMPSMDGFAGKICGEFGNTGSKAGQAFGNTMTEGVDGGVKRSSGLLSGLGTVARGVGTVAAAGMSALTGAVTAIGGAALSAYADYEQLVGGVDTLFGSASGQLQAYAADAYKTCGMSANQYMTQATSFAASLVSSCGGDVAKAADYANMAMGDMSDNVNKMGSDMTDVQNAYQGFAKQNYTMLDNLKLGYGGTKEEMQRLISDANKLREAQGKNADLTIDSYADVVEAIHTVQENMGITGTTAKEAATTISGSVGMAKAAWENFITGLGRDDVDFSQLTEQLLTSIGAVATNVAPRVAQIGEGIIQAFPVVLSSLGTVLAPIVSEALATAWNIAVQALAGIGIHLPEIDASQILDAFQTIADVASTVVGVVRSAFEAVWPVLSQFGQTITNIGAAVMPVLQNAFALILPLIGQAISLVTQLFSALSPLVAQVGAALMPALTAIGTALANLAAAVLPGLAAAVQIVFSVLQMLMPVIQTVLSVVGSIVSVVVTVMAQVISAVVNAAAVVASVISGVLSVVSGLVAAVTTFIGSILAVVGGCVSTVAALIAGVVNTVVSCVGSLVSSVLSAISGMVSGISSFFQSIVSTMSNAASSAYSAVTGAFNSMVGAVSGAVGNLMGVVSGIPGQIMGFFAGAGSWLVDSGRSIINGLVSGIQSAIGGAVDAVSGAVSKIRSFFPFSPAKTGPFSGHGYTTFSGKALMEGWAQGIGGGTGSVVSAISGAMDTAQGMLATGLTVAPVAAGAAVAGGVTYNVTVNGSEVDCDQRIRQAIDVLVSSAKRSSRG